MVAAAVRVRVVRGERTVWLWAVFNGNAQATRWTDYWRQKSFEVCDGEEQAVLTMGGAMLSTMEGRG